MKIANQHTFQQFDKLKEQLFHKKHLEHKTKQMASQAISAKFRLVLPFTLIAGGLWMVYKNTPTIKEMLLKKGKVTHQQLISYEAIQSYLKCRWNEFLQNPKGKLSHNLINDLYIIKLQSDLLYLTEKRAEKNLNIETQTYFSWWTLNFGNLETIYLISSYGDLIARKRKSKLMIGNSLRIWKNIEDTIVQRDKFFKYYLAERGKIGQQCEKVNWLNKLQLSKQQHQKCLTQCKIRSNEVALKIEKVIQKRLKEEQSRQVKNQYN